jgi:hypothetical protein
MYRYYNSPIAGTPHPLNNSINSISVSGSGKGSSSFLLFLANRTGTRWSCHRRCRKATVAAVAFLYRLLYTEACGGGIFGHAKLAPQLGLVERERYAAKLISDRLVVAIGLCARNLQVM